MSTRLAFPDTGFHAAAQSTVASPVRPFATSLVLVAVDVLAIFMAHALAFWGWRLLRAESAFPNFTGACETLGLLLLTYAGSGLYAGRTLGAVEELRRAVLGTALVSLVLTASPFFLQQAVAYSRGGVLLCGFCAAILVPVMRSVARGAFAARRCGGVPAVLSGAGETARMLIDRLRQDPPLNFTPARGIASVMSVKLRQNLLTPLNRSVKRGLDVAAALLVGFTVLPVLMVTSFWVKWVSPGSALYWQEREGEAGRSILVPKLRTMYADAEKALTRVLSQSPEIHAEWICRFKLKDDPRVLPGVGKFLRRTSFDELPQLWSVLIGEMSLVGPRPLPRYHLDAFSPRFRALRQRAKPGLTGLWQVSDRADGDLQVQETLDTYYIRNWSLWLDLYILARTVRAVLFPRGAY
jgi:lipopolysaccharide/colanic/teichoic acid biosynthesis glycosyltransferase